jgi:hypothetical protein
MNKTIEYFVKLEGELRRTRAVSDQLCSEFSALLVNEQLAFSAVIEFLGCRPATAGNSVTTEAVPDMNRLRAVRLMYLKVFVDTGEPRWSSLMLERLVAAVMVIPGGGVNDVLCALFTLLGENDAGPTRPMTNFLKQIVVLCFSLYRKSYEAADFSWLEKGAREGLNSGQAYLALYAHPQPTIRAAILKALDSSPYKDEAIRVLSDD